MDTVEPAPILRTEEAAAALGVAGRTVLRYLKDGRIQGFQTPGGHHRIPQSEIDRLHQEECKPYTPEGWPQVPL